MTESAQPKWAGELIDLLERQRQVYRQLHELSGEQSRLVAEGDAERLLQLLSRRQGLVDELSQLNGQLEPYKQDWAAVWAELDAAHRSRVQGLIDEVRSLLDEILSQDEQDRAALSDHRDRVSSELQHARAGSTVHRAYGQAAAEPDSTRYTDQQG